MKKDPKAIVGDKVIGTKSESMPVKLTPEELAEMSRRLAHVQEEMESHESHAKQVKAGLAATQERLASERSLLAMNVRNKAEIRPVEIQEEADFKSGVVIEVRADTETIVRKRVLHQHERQQYMDLRTDDTPPPPAKHQPKGGARKTIGPASSDPKPAA